MESNTKHTPGPWTVDGYNLTAVIAAETKPGATQEWTTYKHVCDCNYGHAAPEIHFEENKANAKLIATAPEMKTLLVEEVEYLDMWMKGLPAGSLTYSTMNERKQFILETIKKATE